MPRYKIIAGRHRREEQGRRVRYVPGDTILLTEEQAEQLAGKVEKVMERGQQVQEPEQPEPEVESVARQEDLEAMLQHQGGGWYMLPDGSRIRGKEEALKALGYNE